MKKPAAPRIRVDTTPRFPASRNYLGTEVLRHQDSGRQQASPGARWYCVVAQPFRDLLAARTLQRERNIDLAVFLPFYVDRRGKRPVIGNLFPGYLFAAFDVTRTPWGWVQHMEGVRCVYSKDRTVRLVSGGGDAPTPVREGVVEALIARARQCGGMIDDDVPATIDAGKLVRISSGPLQGELALTTRQSAAERLMVLHALLNGARLVIDREAVEFVT